MTIRADLKCPFARTVSPETPFARTVSPMRRDLTFDMLDNLFAAQHLR